jgi:Flp pilus assembly protein TadG
MRLPSARSRTGSAAVELAVVLPFLAFLFVITIDFARIFYVSLTLSSCARNGMIYASNIANYSGWEGSSSQISSVQQAAVADGTSLNPALTTSNVSVVTGTSNGHSVVTVTVSYTFSTITNFPTVPSVTISRSEQTRVAPAAPS